MIGMLNNETLLGQASEDKNRIMRLNKYSQRVTQDDSQPAAQAMLHAIGLNESDFDKPFVGIASTGYEGNPCNMHLNDLAKEVKKRDSKCRFSRVNI